MPFILEEVNIFIYSFIYFDRKVITRK